MVNPQLIFGSAGCVIDGNWLLYPGECPDGYNDHDDILVEFRIDDHSESILDITMHDLYKASINSRGLITIMDHTVQLLVCDIPNTCKTRVSVLVDGDEKCVFDEPVPRSVLDAYVDTYNGEYSMIKGYSIDGPADEVVMGIVEVRVVSK